MHTDIVDAPDKGRFRVGRREALQSGAAWTLAVAAPTIVPATALGRAGRAAPSERISLGFLGVGGRGRALLRGFLNCPEAQCLAVCDPYTNRREATAAMIGGQAYPDFREVIAREDIDAVVIASPDHWHVLMAVAAARAGKHIYMEKPLGLTIEQDLVCRRVVRESGVVFQYGTQHRSSPQARFGCELVRNGRIGEIRELEVRAVDGGAGGCTVEVPVPPELDYDMWLGPAPLRPYTVDRCKTPGAFWIYDYSIGYLAGWGSHPLSILAWGCQLDLAGPLTVEGTGVIPKEGLYDTVYGWDVRIEFAGGATLRFLPGGGPDGGSTRFVGTDGWVDVQRQLRSGGGVDAEPKSLLETSFDDQDVRLVDSRRHDQNFLDAILGRQSAVASLEDAVRSDILSHLSDIAVRTGRRITWDPAKETIVDDEEAARMLRRPMREPWTLSDVAED